MDSIYNFYSAAIHGTLPEKPDVPNHDSSMPGFALAMAYVPFQLWEQPYDPQTALTRGTIFPSLDKPFIGEEAVPYGKR